MFINIILNCEKIINQNKDIRKTTRNVYVFKKKYLDLRITDPEDA